MPRLQGHREGAILGAQDRRKTGGLRMRLLSILAGAIALCACATARHEPAPAPAADAGAILVMVVGSDHMGGSSGDIISVKPESPLTPRRQEELARVAAALAEFRPTAVVVERVTPAPDYLDPVFKDFSDTMLAEKEDERVQIAYRLASLAGVARVYGIDEHSSEGEPDYFPFGKIMEHAERTGQTDAVDALIAGIRSKIEDFARETADVSIGERLYRINTGFMSAPDANYALMNFDRGEDQPGAELQGYWMMRNAKIFSKLMNVTKPGDRVVIVYGAGHKFWLEHFAERAPGFVKVDPAPYLQRAAAE